jgi:hypothetical protein
MKPILECHIGGDHIRYFEGASSRIAIFGKWVDCRDVKAINVLRFAVLIERCLRYALGGSADFSVGSSDANGHFGGELCSEKRDELMQTNGASARGL